MIQTAFQRGLLLLGCGESRDSLLPAVVVSAAQVDKALAILDGVL